MTALPVHVILESPVTYESYKASWEEVCYPHESQTDSRTVRKLPNL